MASEYDYSVAAQREMGTTRDVTDGKSQQLGFTILPEAFCWTKIGTEAGEQLDDILRRKENERTAGDGLFFWGIGNSIGQKVRELLRRVDRPKVAFSRMRATCKSVDRSPARVFVWTAYYDQLDRLIPLPDHVLLSSRGTTRTGIKKQHYSLICRSSAPLRLGSLGTIDLGLFRNLGSRSPRVGASQVTAVIERHQAPAAGPTYEIDMVAEFSPPYFVRLANPRELGAAERALLDAHADREGCSSADWTALVGLVKAQARPVE